MKFPALVVSSPRFAHEAGRLALIVFFLISYFIIHNSYFATTAKAAAVACPPYSTAGFTNSFNKAAISGNEYDDKVFNFNQWDGSIDSLDTVLTGCSSLHPSTNSATAGHGALAVSGQLVASLYGAPPASGVVYFAQEIQKLNPIKPVYAQGIGAQAINPVLPLWRTFRNASYALFVIVFVIVGFMIMFRAHISPQAVATIQDTLPRLVIALILVTFSYAIAGLMIDLMFVLLNIAITVLGLGSSSDVIFKKNIFQVIFTSWGEVFKIVSDAIGDIINKLVSGGLLLTVLGAFGGKLASLVIGIALLFIMFRIFFMLLLAYIMIILLTIIAPFFFLFQALPGQNGARAWFQQMAAQLGTFLIVAIMILFAGYIGNITSLGFSGGPSVTGEATKFPLLSGGLSFAAIGKLIAIGFLLMTPEAANLVRNMLNVKGPQFGGAIGGVIAAGAAPFGAAGRAGIGAAWTQGPIGALRRERQAVRQEQASIRARKSIYLKPPKGLTDQDISQYGVGFPKKS